VRKKIKFSNAHLCDVQKVQKRIKENKKKKSKEMKATSKSDYTVIVRQQQIDV
jgi:hypothetical protein